jgi:hypothetical protein
MPGVPWVWAPNETKKGLAEPWLASGYRVWALSMRYAVNSSIGPTLADSDCSSNRVPAAGRAAEP